MPTTRWICEAFTYLPVENLVYANQEAYYNAIALSSAQANSAPFIDFMLQEIYNTLLKQANDTINGTINGKINGIINGKINGEDIENNILKAIRKENSITIAKLAAKMGVSARQISRAITKLKAEGKLLREGSNKTGHWRVQA